MVTDNLITDSTTSGQNNDEDVLVKVENVSKKFCRTLKKSLWYGLQDIGSEIVGRKYEHELRPDEFWSVKDVSFELRRGECLGLIGPNGAGKSTLLKMLNGLIKPDCGRIEIRGQVGALIELGVGFNPILTGRENIYNKAAVLGLKRSEIEEKIEAIIEFSEIGEFLDMPVQNYSSGMKVRLGFAVSIQLNPDILIVDEVLAVGDVGFRMKCYEQIFSYIEKGGSVIIVTHSMLNIGRVASRVGVMNHGAMELMTSEVPKAIMLYERISNKMKSSSSNQNTSALEVTQIEVGNGTPNGNEFKTFDDIPISIVINNSSNATIECRVLIVIESLSLGLLAGFSSAYSNKYFDIIPGENTIGLKLLRIPFLQGEYFINVNLYGRKNTEFYGRFQRLGNFIITQPKTCSLGYGLSYTVLTEHEWKD